MVNLLGEWVQTSAGYDIAQALRKLGSLHCAKKPAPTGSPMEAGKGAGER